jgi:hypothetical protein
MMKKLLYLFLVLPFVALAQNQYNYGFSGTTADMTTAGWVRTNQSTSASATLWTVASYTPVTVSATVQALPFSTQAYTNGQTCPVPVGKAGGNNSFALVNFTSTSSTLATGATISNWLISPSITVQTGDVVSFYSRIGKFSATNTASYPDNLQLRMSTNGAFTADPTGGPAAVGDYSELLVETNPDLDVTSYPATWTLYSYTVTGLDTPTDCKFAFRYYVTDGGPQGNNSDIIGIDSFSVDRPLATNDFFKGNFSVYPNPATNVLNISNRNNLDITAAQITDVNGRVVAQTTGAVSQINIADLTAGVYFLKVTSTQGVGTTRVVKN